MVFDTVVGNMVVLVIDKDHSRYGEVGKMVYHDWNESGDIGVEFSDGYREDFYDGIMKGDGSSQIKRFYRLADAKGLKFDSQDDVGPESFKRVFVEHGGNLETLVEQYKSLFGEELDFSIG